MEEIWDQSTVGPEIRQQICELQGNHISRGMSGLVKW